MHEKRECFDRAVLALVGNPNVGKSTLFNRLTGGRQHTGNWSGKTVEIAEGEYFYKGKTYKTVDLPGTYSLESVSQEERVALEYIRSGEPDCVLIVADATCLERNLCFALQVMAVADSAVLCINFMDEAARQGLKIDTGVLQSKLGIPVVGISAGTGEGIRELKEALRGVCDGFIRSKPADICKTMDSFENCSEISASLISDCVLGKTDAGKPYDKVLLGRFSGSCIMMLLLLGVFWLTVIGANYPSRLLENIFSLFRSLLHTWLTPLPPWLSGLLVDGIYHTTASVISVMLPPMLIFFPLFSFLEDLGYLPRAAFLMDHTFEKCGSCGKQMLTMSMGFGCNAVGVMGCRIISSPRERLLAILTNAFVPCNGRFPAIICLICYVTKSPFFASLLFTGTVLLSVAVTFGATKFLGQTLLQGEPSHFVLEIPPIRKPCLKKIFLSALKERTMFVLLRAVMVAAPAGAVIWILQNISVSGQSVLEVLSGVLDPAGAILGMNGAILLAFILAFPANELFLPMVLTLSADVLGTGTETVSEFLAVSGWTRSTVICTLVFILFHWPCSTTCLTVHRETGSIKWTLASIFVPTLVGVVFCAVLNFCL